MKNYISLLTDAWQGKPVALRSPHWHKVEHNHLLLNPKCLECFASTKLQVHHVLPFHLFPALELEPTNLITLCAQCHLYVGHGGDWKAFIPRVVEYIHQGIPFPLFRARRIYSVSEASADVSYIEDRIRRGLPLI